MSYVPRDNAKQQIARLLSLLAWLLAAMAVAGFFGVREEKGTAEGIAAGAVFAAFAGLAAYHGRRLMLSWREDEALRREIVMRIDELAHKEGVLNLTAIALEKGTDQVTVRRAVAWGRWSGMLPVPVPPGVRIEHAGKVLSAGDIFALFVVTLGLYTFFWIYRVIQELQRHDPGGVTLTPGRAVGLCFVPVFNLYWLPHLYAFVVQHINANYRRFEASIDLMQPRTPVIAFVVANLLPLLSIGLIPLAVVLMPIPIALVQGTLNRYWLICQAGDLQGRATLR